MDSAAIEEALKANRKALRRAKVSRQRIKVTPHALILTLSIFAIAVGAVGAFVWPKATDTRGYSLEAINAQALDRRGQEIEAWPAFSIINVKPFPPESDVDLVLVVGGGTFQAAVANKGELILEDGEISIEDADTIEVLGTRRVGRGTKGPSLLFGFLPKPLRALAAIPLTQGSLINLEEAARSTITGFPIFIVPDADRLLFNDSSVDKIERTKSGLVVTFSDGFTGLDIAFMLLMGVGLIGVGRSFV